METTRFRLRSNGSEREVRADENLPLLDVLREECGLKGTRFGCGVGECGACHVLVDGVSTPACDTPVGAVQGKAIVTVEGLADGADLHPVQQCFVEAGAVQCGFCTPGLIVAAHDLLARQPRPSDPEIREALAGNLCRCTGYESILAAETGTRAPVSASMVVGCDSQR